MLHGKFDECKTCVNQADLISPAEEAICPDCVNGSEYVESYTSGLLRRISELNHIVASCEAQLRISGRDLKSGIKIVNKQIKEIAELKQTLGMAIEALEIFSNLKTAYPESVFPPMGKVRYKLMCDSANVSVDRVSAHVLREVAKGYSELADKTLSRIKDQEV